MNKIYDLRFMMCDLRRSMRVALMDEDPVSVRVTDDGELANGSGHGFHDKFHTLGFQAGDLGVEIIGLEGDAGPVRRRLPDIAVATDAKSAVAEIIFHPHAAGGFHGGLESEHAFVEGAGAFDVSDRGSGECDFRKHGKGLALIAVKLNSFSERGITFEQVCFCSQNVRSLWKSRFFHFHFY